MTNKATEQAAHVPEELRSEYEDACNIVRQYEELRSFGDCIPADKSAWAGEMLFVKSLIERIATLTSELADERLAFAHANEVVGKLEGELAEARAQIVKLSAPVSDLAKEIVTRIVTDTITLQWIRNIADALPDKVDADDSPTEQELLEDALALALGDDIGCMDEDDDDFRERVCLYWLEDKLTVGILSKGSMDRERVLEGLLEEAVNMLRPCNPQDSELESLPECPEGHPNECGSCDIRHRINAALIQARTQGAKGESDAENTE